jgi:predicted DNA-binding transcriptional regulator AlpA
MEYEFTLKYKVADAADMDELIEQLGEVGCDDAVIGTGQPGRLALDFMREAASAEKAIVSALAAVKKAIPGARLVEVTPDFVGMTELADLLGVSRQNIQKLKQAHSLDFPSPVHEGNAAVWHLAHLLIWFKKRASYDIKQAWLDVAQAAMQINLAKEATQLEPRVQNKVLDLVA